MTNKMISKKTFIYNAVMNIELLCKVAPVLMEIRDAILDGSEHVNPEIYGKAVLKAKEELVKKAEL